MSDDETLELKKKLAEEEADNHKLREMLQEEDYIITQKEKEIDYLKKQNLALTETIKKLLEMLGDKENE